MSTVRADARRNRARVLAAADELFAAEGLAAPVEAIAHRAGVGPGTIYRHFPTKEALFEAVVGQRLAQFGEDGRRLATAADPGAAFAEFFARSVARAAVNHALCDAIEAGTGRQAAIPPTAREEFQAALNTLLVRAQQSGAVRPDVDIDDVSALLTGCLHAETRRGRPGRMISLALETLWAQPAPGVTKDNETPCPVCGTPLRSAPTGRPARFCSAACRQRAHRRRTPKNQHSA